MVRLRTAVYRTVHGGCGRTERQQMSPLLSGPVAGSDLFVVPKASRGSIEVVYRKLDSLLLGELVQLFGSLASADFGLVEQPLPLLLDHHGCSAYLRTLHAPCASRLAQRCLEHDGKTAAVSSLPTFAKLRCRERQTGRYDFFK